MLLCLLIKWQKQHSANIIATFVVLVDLRGLDPGRNERRMELRTLAAFAPHLLLWRVPLRRDTEVERFNTECRVSTLCIRLAATVTSTMLSQGTTLYKIRGQTEENILKILKII